MTAQITDRIRIDGQEFALFSEPLRPLLAERDLRFASPNTALWRGYIAYWEVVDGQLFLVAFQGCSTAPAESSSTEPPGKRSPFDVTLEDLFPNSNQPVLACWFTGALRIPQGKMLEYGHMGYESVYESYRILDIRGGVVGSSRVEKSSQH